MLRNASSLLCSLSLIAFAASSSIATAEPSQKQIVLISFDGAHDNRLWQRSRTLGAETGAHFTYFLSCVFFSDKQGFGAYKAPGQKVGRSNVGFAPDRADAVTRLGHIWGAAEEGHEIGSHGCGHFNGEHWSKAGWADEFRQFHAYLSDAYRINDAIEHEPAGWRDFADTAVKGFRAPYLATGPGLYAALEEAGFTYDASSVSRGPANPDLSQAVARFSLPLIPEGPANRNIIAMDYNLFVRHSGGLENPSGSAEFEERAYQAFKAAFERELNGKRRPLEMGFHFVEMNGGAYWRALERFARETCTRDDVDCITYSEALHRLKGRETADGGS